MASGTRLGSVRAARGRALCVLALFALGAVIAARLMRSDHEQIAILSLGASGLCVAFAVLLPAMVRSYALAVAVLLLGIGWCALRVDPMRPDRLSARVGVMDAQLGSIPIEVRGVVSRSSRVVHRVRGLADPPMWPDETNRAELHVQALLLHMRDGRTDWVDASGTLRIVLKGDLALRAGAQVELLGKYNTIATRRNPGDPDWDLLASQSGRVGTLVVDDASHVRPIAPGGLIARAQSWVLRVRDTIRSRAIASIGGDDAAGGVRSALLLGERQARFESVFTSFQRVGVAHLIAISGFHLALVVFVCVLLVRLVGDHPRTESAIVLLVLLGVLLLIPLRPPIVRAALIVGALLLATRLGRRYDRMTVLAWVGVGLLVWRPLDAMSMGYQLSMGVTGLLVVLGDREVASRMAKDGVLRTDRARGVHVRVLGWLWALLRVNGACWLVALPTVVYHAGVVGTLAPIATLVLLPFIALLMSVGYVQVLIGIVSPKLAMHTLWLVEGPSAWALELIGWFEQLPFAWVRVPGVSVWWTIACTIVLALVVTGYWRWKRPLSWIVMLVVLMWGVLQPRLNMPTSLLRVVMLDVGDGSCVIVQSGNEAILWDCGSLDRRIGASAGRSLRTLGVTRLRSVLVTHDNLDHFNGLPDLMESITIDEVRITTRLRDDPSPSWVRVRSALEAQGASVQTLQRGDVLQVAHASMEILWPDPALIDGYDDNDTSLVALIVSGAGASARLLLTGDIERDAMERLQMLEPELPGELAGGAMELPHHGSAREAAHGFVDWLRPGVVMQSTGPSRLDDDRWSAQRVGRDWYTTARGGAIVVEFGDAGRVETRYWFGR